MADIVKRDDLTITETLCESLWQVTAWPGRESAVAATLPAQPEPGQTRDGVARTGPLSWVVFDPEKAPAVDAGDGAALDISHSRKRFRIRGTRARDVMMRLAPLDFRDKAFPDNHVKATTAHHMSVSIVRHGEAWDVYVGFTFAGVMREVLEETAAQWEKV